MAKKRPSFAGRRSLTPSRRLRSKMESDYWRGRLFRNTFTHNGGRFQVNHWWVKIQHLRARKTYSLLASDPAQAAVEACRLYKKILTQGWEEATAPGSGQGSHPRPTPVTTAADHENGFQADYWTQRLIHRKYTEELHENAERELSARVHYAGTSHYFPLGTDNRKRAAKRVVRIYRTVVEQGWDSANERFPRELSVAFRWADNPVAWTYTTIHTRTSVEPHPAEAASGRSSARLNVAIIESDAGIRRALAWCINQQPGCRCLGAYGSSAAALRELPKRPVQLILVNEALPDLPGAACLEKLKVPAPETAGLVFSVYEDCDQLFKRAPGGAGSYWFRRTRPDRVLEPIAAAMEKETLDSEVAARSVRNYFQATIASFPVGGSTQEVARLTQREQEILALLSKGQADKEIADLLHISTWTVHGHVKKIYEKLGAHNRTEAALKYLHK